MTKQTEYIKQGLSELIGDYLDSEMVKGQEIIINACDPQSREKSELHIRMANAAMLEYEKTCLNIEESSVSYPDVISRRQEVMTERHLEHCISFPIADKYGKHPESADVDEIMKKIKGNILKDFDIQKKSD